jgi:hypothetical protein
LSAALDTVAALAARVVATGWPTLLFGSRLRLDLVEIFFSHDLLRSPLNSTVSEETGSFVFLNHEGEIMQTSAQGDEC